MITKEKIDNFQKQLEDSYRIPVSGNINSFEKGFNEILMHTMEDLVKLKLYLKDFPKEKIPF